MKKIMILLIFLCIGCNQNGVNTEKVIKNYLNAIKNIEKYEVNFNVTGNQIDIKQHVKYITNPLAFESNAQIKKNQDINAMKIYLKDKQAYVYSKENWIILADENIKLVSEAENALKDYLFNRFPNEVKEILIAEQKEGKYFLTFNTKLQNNIYKKIGYQNEDYEINKIVIILDEMLYPLYMEFEGKKQNDVLKWTAEISNINSNFAIEISDEALAGIDMRNK